MLAKRVAMVYFLHEGTSLYKISHLLKVSPSTVARFALKLEGGSFHATAAWLKRVKIGKPLLQLLVSIAAVPFDAQRKSLALLSKEW